MRIPLNRLAAALLVSGVAYSLSHISTLTSAQDNPTPIVVQLASPTPLPVIGAGATSTPMPTPTETPIGPVQVQVAEGQGNVNVRSDSDPESEILGVIAPGESYPVTGRYYRWIQFRFPNSPNGLGYVYDELIQLVGDLALIPDLTIVDTVSDIASASVSGLDVIPILPGADATITAEARVLVGPVGVDPDATFSETSLNPEGGVRLPTYTPVPNLGDLLSAANLEPTATAVPDLLNIRETASNLPPIAPILLLGGIGTLGLMVSLLRKS